MEQAEDQSGKRKTWLIVFVVTLFVLAAFWSVDPSVFYVLLGVAGFSLYKILAHRKPAEGEPTYRETYRQPQPSFWDDVKKLFRNPGATHDSRQRVSKLVSFVIAGSVGLIFFIIVLSVVFSDDSPDSAELRQQASDLYYRQAYDSAAYLYGKAIQADPEDADLYLERGNAFLYADKADSALLDYNRALELRPSFKEANYNRGLIYFNRKQYRNAINEIKKAVETDPEYMDAMVLIGNSFYNSSQLDSAMVWYERASAKGYKEASVSHIMAYIYDKKANTKLAIVYYKEALSLDPARTEINTRLGELIPGDEGEEYRQKAAQYPVK